MLDIHSLQNFEFMNNFSLIAGNAGLYKNVTNVVILDYEGIEEEYYGFHEGDFVITNLMFAKRHPERIYNSFKALISIGVSAFAIKTVIFTELPEEVIELANQKQVPIFLFNDIFIEDVILNITDHLRSSTNFNYNENLIDKIISPVDNSKDTKDLITSLEIDDMNAFCSAMYLGYNTQIDKFSLQRTISKLQIQIQHLQENCNLKLTLYKNGILFISIFSNALNEKSPIKCDENYWNTLLKHLGMSSIKYRIGISDMPLPIEKLNLTIMRCLNAYNFPVDHFAQQENNQNYLAKPENNEKNMTSYEMIGTYNLFYPFFNNEYVYEYLLEVVKKLQPKCSSFKDFKSTNIYLTLNACIKADFDMYKAADILFQHQNTVRYRLKKLQNTLEIQDETNFRVLVLFLIEFTNQF